MDQSWSAALCEGLRNVRFAGADSLQVECAFYGHLYNDGKSGPMWQYEAGDLVSGIETELLVSLAAATAEPSDASAGKAGYAPRSVQWAVGVLQSKKFLGGATTAIIGFIKQVARYLQDEEFKEKVCAEFSAAMEVRPRLVLAHSLGSVIAYDWLRSHPPTTASTLITLGSPLGLRPILSVLHPYIDSSLAPWPVGIERWVNIAAKEDVVATVKTLDGLFAGTIHDLPASNSRRAAHDAGSYLRNVRTAESVKAALV